MINYSPLTYEFVINWLTQFVDYNQYTHENNNDPNSYFLNILIGLKNNHVIFKLTDNQIEFTNKSDEFLFLAAFKDRIRHHENLQLLSNWEKQLSQLA